MNADADVGSPITEHWLPIADFPDYEVSALGRVRRATDGGRCRAYHAGTIIKPFADHCHKLEVHLTRAGKRYYKRLARLVLETFIGACPAHHHIDWSDGDGSNNAVSNLTYVPYKHLNSLPKTPIIKAPKPPKLPKAKPVKLTQPKIKTPQTPAPQGHWLTLLTYYQALLAAPDATPQHRMIAAAGLRAIERRYRVGKKLMLLRMDERTIPMGTGDAERLGIVGD